ncbi:hypothetical protein GM658_22590 [Pseudoduganella eburnea]|uniref:ABC transporter substrate-binding protein n=1 Tax=Massilia eburnea TaxID=1776165 RepID=A0A6L6QMJ7_9BURK|nr:hypothetical protein [Massilia eburnea]MTW13400.1 hypothetical protein [Massilia eburnea]
MLRIVQILTCFVVLAAPALQARTVLAVIIGAEVDWAPHSSTGNAPMLARFNEGYAELRKSPRYKEIEERWFK